MCWSDLLQILDRYSVALYLATSASSGGAVGGERDKGAHLHAVGPSASHWPYKRHEAERAQKVDDTVPSDDCRH
jgi:hypothetical protein